MSLAASKKTGRWIARATVHQVGRRMNGTIENRLPPTAGSTTEATVQILDRCTPDILAGLVADGGLGAFGHYSPPAAMRQLGALVRVAGLPHGRVLVALEEKRVVGYLTFHPPDAEGRWAKLPAGHVLELGGIEVGRGRRDRGLAKALMRQAFSTPDFDRAIIYAQALTWCWDLEGSGLSRADYRLMMLRLFAAYEFQPCTTDEPNIRYDRANLLLVRVGHEAPNALLQQFRATLIGPSAER
jgi:acetoin utilization protein AcuA